MSEPNESTPPPAPPEPSAETNAISAEQRQWAMFAHLSAIVGGILTSWFFGIGCLLGPLIIWLVKKETMPFVDDQGKEALNFNITLAGLFLILMLLSLLTLGIGFLVTVPIMLIVGVAALVFIVIAAIKANEGVAYRYPFAVRLIK